MVKLSDTVIRRGGVTSPYRHWETSSCFLEGRGGALLVQFSISSKGGGRTAVHLTVGREDLPTLLDEIASEVDDGLRLLLDAQERRIRTLADVLEQHVESLRGLSEAVDHVEAAENDWDRDMEVRLLRDEISGAARELHETARRLRGPDSDHPGV